MPGQLFKNPAVSTGLPPGHVGLFNSYNHEFVLHLDARQRQAAGGSPRPVVVRLPVGALTDVTREVEAQTGDAHADVRALIERSPETRMHHAWLQLVLGVGGVAP